MVNNHSLSIENKKDTENLVENKENFMGLNDKEVTYRKKLGKVNKIKNISSKSFWDIVRGNVFTLFNGINFVLLMMVIITGSFKNGLFAGVIIINSLVGIIQEMRAKKIVEKISVLNTMVVKVIRNGIKKEVPVDEVVVDDIIKLNEGQQVVVDSELLSKDYIELDESLLTGETEPIKKECGETILAGSLVLAGGGYARAKLVGEDTYAAKLAKEAKKFKLSKSELNYMVDKILKLNIKCILPIGTLLIITQLIHAEKNWKQALIGAISGVSGMIPGGLVLLITTSFIVSVIKLSKKRTLVQELPATEILARVDTLCLDKTGTITEGKLTLEEIKPLNNYNIEEIENNLAPIAQAFINSNSTLNAIKEKYENDKKVNVKKVIPFKSSKKWSGVQFENGDKWILGAPEILLKKNYNNLKQYVQEEAEKGRRILSLVKVKSGELTEELPNNLQEVALILFEDVIRKEASATLKYFDKQGVDIKIISGDNPVTVSSIAKKAGVKEADSYIDGKNLPEDEEELISVINKTTIFGRTTPHQKKAIVKALQRDKKTVAMTGDGVNDVLALKESDCGIAMASGSDASKAVAQLVLLDSNFSTLPYVVEEGRRSINNIEKVANLYLSKTVYSIIMSVIFCLLLLPYPIIPIQLTFIGTFTIGIPSFFLSMEPNNNIVKEGFLKRVLLFSISNGIATSISTLIMFFIAYYSKLSIEQTRSLSFLVMYGVSLIILIKTSIPFTRIKALLSSISILAIFIVLLVPKLREFFMVYDVKFYYLIIAFLLIFMSLFIMKFTKNVVNKHLDKYFNKLYN